MAAPQFPSPGSPGDPRVSPGNCYSQLFTNSSVWRNADPRRRPGEQGQDLANRPGGRVAWRQAGGAGCAAGGGGDSAPGVGRQSAGQALQGRTWQPAGTSGGLSNVKVHAIAKPVAIFPDARYTRNLKSLQSWLGPGCGLLGYPGGSLTSKGP